MKTYLLTNPTPPTPAVRALLDELRARGLPAEVLATDTPTPLDLDAPPPAGVFVNLADPAAAAATGRPDATRELLVWLESAGRRVLNGAAALALETSAVRRHSALRAAKAATPAATAVIGGRESLRLAARTFRLPFVLRSNRPELDVGGSSRVFRTREAFEAYLDSEAYEPKADFVTLLREHVEPRDATFVRVTVVGGVVQSARRLPLDTALSRSAGAPAGEPVGRFDDSALDRVLLYLYANRVDAAAADFAEDPRGRTVVLDVSTHAATGDPANAASLAALVEHEWGRAEAEGSASGGRRLRVAV